MKTIQFRRIGALVAVAGLLASGLMGPTPAAAQTVERPIEEFVAAQGTFDIGFLFVPPVPNFLGTSDPEAELSMSVDYAGLADATCDGIAGTTFDGTVQEMELDDGRAAVSVELFTSDAISWVVDGFDFTAGPVIFGTRWEDDDGECVIDGPLALGDSQLKVIFTNPEPGHPLPDLIQLLAAPEAGQELLEFKFHAEAVGQLPDGTPALAETHQVAKEKDGALTFSVENVFIELLD